MKVSFVVVNYNRKREILLTITKTELLPGFNRRDHEIIVVDNASIDGSAAAISELHPDVILVANEKNIGVPAWNIGFEVSSGDYFVILDDDSHIELGLDKAITYLDKHENVGILALNIQGGAFQTSDWKHLHHYSGFIGCGAIIRRSLYDLIGGYADWIFLYTNEYEYGMRCMQAGYDIIYYGNCLVSHRTSNINRSSKRLVTYSVRNEMAIVYKYFSKKSRNAYLRRVYLNNLRCISEHGLRSIPWYLTALSEFYKIKKTLPHTPVQPAVEKFYSMDFWSTRRFLGIF
jgi:GT2 family glycosyltransferase